VLVTVSLAPDDWLNPKILYYWRQKKNDKAISKSIMEDIEEELQMKGRYGVRYSSLLSLFQLLNQFAVTKAFNAVERSWILRVSGREMRLGWGTSSRTTLMRFGRSFRRWGHVE
jgi:hypothetical protein